MSRLAELGIERSVAASVILGVVAQRLVRLNCACCAQPDVPNPLYMDCLGIPRSEVDRFRRSPGCPECGFTGSRGRTGMFELLEMTGRIRELFAENPEGNESRIRRAATEAGMVTLMQQAAALAVAGAISIDEAYRFGYAGEAS
jgi:type II secretory ATPase GspE/PulE/Tfp pilus assembly ATPase PilB-like protein